MKKNIKYAYTLVELLIVIAAVMLLAAITASTFKSIRNHKDVTLAVAIQDNVAWPEVMSNVSDQEPSRNMVIVFDGSTSMNSSPSEGDQKVSKIDQVKKALEEYLDVLPEDVMVGMVAFYDGRVIQEVPVSSDRGYLLNRIDSIRASGGTPLTQACAEAALLLRERAERHYGPHDKFYLVVVTDGDANDNDKLSAFIELLVSNSPVRVNTIGFDIGEDHVLNQPGKTRYFVADDLEDLKSSFEKVLAEAPIGEGETPIRKMESPVGE